MVFTVQCVTAHGERNRDEPQRVFVSLTYGNVSHKCLSSGKSGLNELEGNALLLFQLLM